MASMAEFEHDLLRERAHSEIAVVVSVVTTLGFLAAFVLSRLE